MIERSRPMPMEIRERLSLVRGSIWPDIERYAKMRMTPQEILTALEVEGRPTFPYQKVENALNKAWKRGILEKRTPEERADARVDHLLRRESLRDRVSAWLNIAPEVEAGKIPTNPSTRMDWKELIATHEEERQRSQLLAKIFPKPELIPQEPLYRSYLADLYHARKAWTEGNRTLLNNFPEYENQDPEITAKLAQQIKIIRELTPLQNGHKYGEDVIATSSDPDK